MSEIDYSDPEEVRSSLPPEPEDKNYCGYVDKGWYYCFGVFMTKKGWLLIQNCLPDNKPKSALDE